MALGEHALLLLWCFGAAAAGVQLATAALAAGTAARMWGAEANVVLVLVLVLGEQFLVDLTVQIEDDSRAGDAVQQALQHGLHDALLVWRTQMICW